jgi:alanine-synthesizing transaminase
VFSSRLSWDSTPNPLYAALARKRTQGVAILDLTESNPTRAGFSYDEAALLAALADPAGLVYDPSPRGLPAARAAVASYYAERGRAVDPDSIFLTASTSEAYAFLFKLVADPGSEILVPRPSYPLLDTLGGLESVRLNSYMLRYDDGRGWALDFDSLRAALTPRTRAVVVVNPNNPTGSYLKPGELAGLNAICAERGLALLVDEVFSDYAARDLQAAAAVRTLAGNSAALTFVMSGLSKVLGLPQVKLGWIQVSGPEPLRDPALARLEFVADAYLSVSAAAQHAATALLAGRSRIQEQIMDRITENQAWLERKCSGLSEVSVLIREGGWYALLKLEFPTDTHALALLVEDNVLYQPGYFYDFEDEHTLVLSLLTPAEIFRTGVASILAWKDQGRRPNSGNAPGLAGAPRRAG